jgi:hypothetical protein
MPDFGNNTPPDDVEKAVAPLKWDLSGLNLGALITDVTSEHPSPAGLRDFVSLCTKIADSHLRRKYFRVQPLVRSFCGSTRDMALDCIADLFQRNEEGVLVQVKTYFGGINWRSSSEQELMAFLCRLVFSKTNIGIFRMYTEQDPIFSKLLRNIKLSLNTFHNFTLVECFGEHYLQPAGCEALGHLPQVDAAYLKSILGAGSSTDTTIPALMARLSHALREQSDYRRLVPLMMLVRVLKSYFIEEEGPAAHVTLPEDAFLLREAAGLIREQCEAVKREMWKQYVDTGKVEQNVYEGYFEVIEPLLSDKLIGNDGDVLSYYQRLKSKWPDLNEAQYRRKERSRFEYLVRITEQRVLVMLKKHIS